MKRKNLFILITVFIIVLTASIIIYSVLKQGKIIFQKINIVLLSQVKSNIRQSIK